MMYLNNIAKPSKQNMDSKGGLYIAIDSLTKLNQDLGKRMTEKQAI